MSTSSINTLVKLAQELYLTNQTTKSTDRKLLKEELDRWIEEDLREKRQYLTDFSDYKDANQTKAMDKILAFFDFGKKSGSLKLSRLGLTSLPNVFDFEFFQRKLKELDLSHNNLQTLPDSLGNLQVLATLNLDHNSLQSLPETLGNLQDLTMLSLEHNNLESLPESLSNLQSLTILYLRANKLKDIPDSLGSLQRLIQLDLGCNKLTHLPESLVGLKVLTELSLSSNQFAYLPEFLGSLRSLVSLRLRNNQFTKLPESLVNLKKLRTLYLGCNCNLSELQLLKKMPLVKVIGSKDCNALNKITLEIDEGSLKEIISQWVRSSVCLEAVHRREAAHKIIEVFAANGSICPGKGDLLLGNLRLTSLPDIFHLEPFQSNLRRLDLRVNRLTSLPEAIGRLQNLEELVLSDNQLSCLPEFLSNLQALKRLDLRVNRLVNLPETIGRLQGLKEMILSSNRITSLPESFSALQALRRLDLDNNYLASFPECLNSLSRLCRLDLTGNNLSDLQGFLPDNLGLLMRLDLGYNRALSGLPMSILQLSSSCTVDLTGCGLSQEVLRRIHEEVMYTGPRINFSYNELISDQIEEKPIEESLEDLYRKANQPLTTFPSAEESSKLRSWLNRLSSMIDYQREGGIQKMLANKVIEYLNLAREDSAFRNSFYEIIEDASGTCGDRMSLSVPYLGIAYQLTTIDIEDMKTLSNFLLKGPWTLEMLGKLARDKINSLRFFDEIEVYLGYPIKLKQELEIPIDVEEMLYFGCSALTDEDLREAKDFVLSQREDEVLCFEFLINHDKWKKALESKYPIEFNKAEENRTIVALENGYESAREEFNRNLVDLTKKALS